VQEVRVGRVVDVELATTDAAEAERQVAQMADALLANPIVEDWTVQWL
jgi:phosphoribosylformylglycinamidine synthase